MPLKSHPSIPVLSLLCVTVLLGQPTPSTTTITAVPRLVRVNSSFHATNRLPATPVEGVTFSIYSQETGGAPLWLETQNVTVDSDGRYSVLLGSTSNEGLPADLFSAGEPRWLGVQFQRAGEKEQPRLLLASVPYALRAADAETLGGLPPSAYLLNPEAATSTSVGPSTSRNALKPTPRFTSTGTANRIAMFTDNAGDIGNSVLFQNGARVGLGTVNPLDYFHVAFTDTTGGVTGYAVQNLGNTSSSYSGMLLYDQNGALGQFQGFNNSTHEYRINNIASNGSINFMLGSSSKFLVNPAGDIDIPGSILKNGDSFIHNLGTNNTAVGVGVLGNPPSGSNNTGVGDAALNVDTTGSGNTAVGSSALASNSTGSQNTAIGQVALSQSTGDANTAIGSGSGALYTGSYNTFIGYQAGTLDHGGDNNIRINNNGSKVAESNTARIGDPFTMTRTFIAGIRGVTTGSNNAITVMIDSNGQLGTASSSRRFKNDIEDMGDASRDILKLRPVTFHYKQQPADRLEYGLIAEEVAEIYPDLVVNGENGQVETVQYHKLTPMVINELQRQNQRAHQQDETIRQERKKVQLLEARVAALESLLSGNPGKPVGHSSTSADRTARPPSIQKKTTSIE